MDKGRGARTLAPRIDWWLKDRGFGPGRVEPTIQLVWVTVINVMGILISGKLAPKLVGWCAYNVGQINYFENFSPFQVRWLYNL